MMTASFYGTSIVPLIAKFQSTNLEKHRTLGIDCSGCHKENPPKQKVPVAVCLGVMAITKS
jgi:hypothetical protein